MPDIQLAVDTVEPYLCFINIHDGSCGVKICMMPVRIVCNNTLNISLNSTKWVRSIRHTESIHEQPSEAHDCLFRAKSYMTDLEARADMAANKTVRDNHCWYILCM